MRKFAMLRRLSLFPVLCLLLLSTAHGQKFRAGIFLHHSTGGLVYYGNTTSVPAQIDSYNTEHGYIDSNACRLDELWWPDGDNEWEHWHRIFANQPAAEDILPILDTNRIVMIKSCFPSSSISDAGTPADTLDPANKTVYNYKWHWRNIINVMRTRPQNYFVIWTNAPLVDGATNDQEAQLSDQFCRWAKDTLAPGLDEYGPLPRNVYIFDFFHKLAGSDGKLPRSYASSSTDSHPNGAAVDLVAPQLVRETFDAAIAYEQGTPMRDTVNGWYFLSASDVSFDTAYSSMQRDRVQGFSSQAFGYDISNMGETPGTSGHGLVWEKKLNSAYPIPDSLTIALKKNATGCNPTISFDAVHDDTVVTLVSWTLASSAWEWKKAAVASGSLTAFDRIRLRIELNTTPFSGAGYVLADTLTLGYTSAAGINLDLFESIPVTVLSVSTMSFGTVDIGCRSTDTVDVSRIDNSSFPLAIDSIICTNPNFHVTPGAAMLADSTSHQRCVVTFAPIDTGMQEGYVVFSYEGGPDSIYLNGYAHGDGAAASYMITEAGWQLISSPLTPLACPHLVNGSFRFENGYRLCDTIEAGRGYWHKGSRQPVVFVGVSVYSITSPVQPRWNMVGALSVPIPISRVGAAPSGNIVSDFYGYSDSGYTAADSLFPGHAYWVKMNVAGTLLLDTASSSGMMPEFVLKTNGAALLSTLTITDAAGRAQTLHASRIAVDETMLAQYELPPPPPAGCFDIRFENGTRLAPPGETLILLSSAVQFPVTLRWIGSDAAITADGRTTALPANSSIVLNAPASRLSLRTESGNGIASPKKFKLLQNYPNPFNPITQLKYELPAGTHVTLKVYDVLGRELAILVNSFQEAGYKTISFDASSAAGGLPSGVYFYTLQADKFTQTKKMLLLR
jgi:hypothetical protein